MPHFRLNSHFFNFTQLVPVCQMVQQGVAAIVGPDDPIVAAHVQSMADVLKVPHIETRFVQPTMKTWNCLSNNSTPILTYFDSLLEWWV